MEKENHPVLLVVVPGRDTGWAACTRDRGRIVTGRRWFSGYPYPYNGGGERYRHFENWLMEVCLMLSPIDKLYFEEPPHLRDEEARYACTGFKESIGKVCRRYSVPTEGFTAYCEVWQELVHGHEYSRDECMETCLKKAGEADWIEKGDFTERKALAYLYKILDEMKAV